MRPPRVVLVLGALLALASSALAHEDETAHSRASARGAAQASLVAPGGAHGHSGRPTSAARRTVSAPDGFDDARARWIPAEPFRSRALARSGARAWRVSLWRDMRHEPRVVLVRGEVEYVLPRGLNRFLAEAGVDASGDAREEVARLVAEAHRPHESARFVDARPIDVTSADGERFTLRTEFVAPAGTRREWEFAFGAGGFAGQVRLAREFEWRDGRRVQVGAARLEPFSVNAHAVTAGADFVFESGEALLLTRVNNTPTGNRGRFNLADFIDHVSGNPETNVYARVVSVLPAYGPLFLDATAVPIDAFGDGTLDWHPGMASLTGIVTLQLGNASPLDPAGTFVPNPAYPNPAFTVERARQVKFPGATNDSARVHYCEQFFQNHALGTAHTETFIGFVESGLADSWQSQVLDWSLAQGHTDGEPLDSDDLHRVFVNDHVNDFRGGVTGGSGSKASVGATSRLVWIRNDGWYNDVGGNPYAVRLYSNEDVRTRIAVAHEFYHGVQAGWITGFVDPEALWLIEGQARALPTVQYAPEEFLDAHQHLYPKDANDLLRNRLNHGLGARSYAEAPYWRFLYDRNHPAGDDALRLRVFREAARHLPGRPSGAGWFESSTTNAVRAALAADGGAFATFEASRDSFAHTIWRHDWPHPTPTSLLYPAVTADPDSDRTSAAWAGGSATFDEEVPVHFGVDYWKFVIATAPPALRRLHLCFDADPERNANHGLYHLTLVTYRGADMRHRVHVLPRALASWDSTLDVTNGDSVAVVVHRVDTLAVEGTYRLTRSEPLAVDGAYWDQIQDVLDGMGPRYRHTSIAQADLGDPSFPWCRYDVVFLNCSPTYVVDPAARDSLREFVDRGGYLYVSDYDYLFVQEAFPGRIAFGGKTGDRQSVNAAVTDPGLVAILGSGTATVHYDLGAWVTVDGAGPGTTVHMFGTYDVSGMGEPSLAAAGHAHAHGGAPARPAAQDGEDAGPSGAPARGPARPGASQAASKSGPLLLSFAHGKGRVIFTTFHNAAQVSSEQREILRYMIFRQVAGDLLADALDAMTPGWHAWQQVVNGIAPGQTRSLAFPNPYAGPIRVILNWGGSNLRLTARRPNGTVAGVVEGPSRPVALDLAAAEAGTWTWEVTALDVPDSNYAFALVVSGPNALPGDPAVGAAPEEVACAGATVLVRVPIENRALYPDSFAVSVSSDLGWAVAPADTTIAAYEGMRDSLAVRLTVPPGTPLGTVDSVRVSLASQVAPANTASGARAARLRALAPDVTVGVASVQACAGIATGVDGELHVGAGCAGDIVLQMSGTKPWPIGPNPQVLASDPFTSVYFSFSVSVPAGTPTGEVDSITVRAFSADDPSLRDSLVVAVQVQFEPPTATAGPPATALRTQDALLYFGVENLAACGFPALLSVTDSLGWALAPPVSPVYLFPGVNLVYQPVTVPAGAPIGASNPVTLTATPIGPPLAATSATGRVFVQVPGEVLLVDPSGGYFGAFIASALDALGRTWTAWGSYASPTAAGLAQFSKVVWAAGSGYLAESDTSGLGGYLRGGGRLLLTGQDLLLDSGVTAPFASAYAGATLAGEGTGTLSVAGRAGTFLSTFAASDLFGPEGAWNQYSPDELGVTGSGFAILDYVPGPPAPAAPGPGARLASPPPGDGGPGSRIARALGPAMAEASGPHAPGRAVRPEPAGAALTTGIAAIANDPGAWRTVFCGFGLEAFSPQARREAALASMLSFLDNGPASATGAPPARVEMAVSPNPAHGATRFMVGLPAATRMRLTLHDPQGRLVAVAHDGPLPAGRHALPWSGRDAAGRPVGAGLYFARLECADGVVVRKIVRL